MKDPLGIFRLEPGILTTVYGPAGSGKTTYSILAAKSLSKQKKALLIDTENGISPERLAQLGKFDFSMLKPRSFRELQRQIVMLCRQTPKLSCIVLDSAAMLYRLETARTKDPSSVNKEMALQLGRLSLIARKVKAPVILTNHVYSLFASEDIMPVGGDLLTYSSKCIVELRLGPDRRTAILRKHRSMPSGMETHFKINEKGFVSVDESPG